MPPESWHILLVDDDDVDRMAVRRTLSSSGLQVTLDEAVTAAEVFQRLSPPGDKYDCLMIDCYLPGVSGLELIRDLRARGIWTPILAVTGRDDIAIEKALIGAGASDYMPKQDLHPERLARRLRYAIRVGRAEAEQAAALRLAQRAVQDRDDLLSIVSHDLRNPLNAIRIAADELADPQLDPEERKVMSAAVQRALRRAERLILDLLDVSRIEAGRLQINKVAVAVRDLLEQARGEHALLSREAGLDLQVRIEPDVGAVLVDRERILQVLGNLLGNAVRYAKGTGKLVLGARTVGNLVEISVQDHGPGIPVDQLPHVFDRFFQARQQRRAGAGLGLAIVKGIVEAHGGTAAVTSEVGKGTCFRFTLPRLAS
ncbi:MAG: hybrid sensor histidine kinase/response regulator [Polyangia bacterium]